MRRGAGDRDLVTEARYWLGETYYRLNRFQQADTLFNQIAGGPKTAAFTVWSLHSSGWTALRLNQMARARDIFAQFQTATPPELEAGRGTVWASPATPSAATTRRWRRGARSRLARPPRWRATSRSGSARPWDAPGSTTAP